MRKLVYGALAAASLTLAVGIGSISASAASPSVSVDYANETLTVTNSSEQILVAYPKVKGEGADATVKVSTWDTYTGNAVIHLSTLNLTKDSNYVLIKGTTSTDPVLIKLSKIDGKVKAKYNAKTGKISNGTADLTDADLAKYQYRTATGNWTEISDSNKLDLSSYQQTGATLYLRTAPEKTNGTLIAGSDKLGGYTYIAMDKAFPGKELKIKVAKLANGPKVAVNYDTKKVTIPSGSEYAYGDKKFPGSVSDFKTALAATTWTQATQKTELALNTDASTDGQLAATFVALRKPATDKKLASKITIYAYAAGAKLATTATGGENASDVALLNAATNGKTITLTPAGEPTGVPDTKVTATYDKNTKALTIKNTGNNTYQVVVSAASGSKDAALSAVKAKVLKATNGTLTYKGVDGQYVYIRTAGDKKTATFASNYVCIGKVTPPAEEENK